MKGYASVPMGTGKYVAIHYSADPAKDQDWVTSLLESGITRRELDREYEMREDVYDGQPVFPDYMDSFHAPEKFAQAIPIMRGSHYIGGWDCGATLWPAFVLLQVMPAPVGQIHWMLEVIPDGAMPMEQFAPMVARAIEKELPGQWDDIDHWADATVTQRSGATGDTAQSVARRHGFNLKAASNALAPRISAVTRGLVDRLDGGAARMIICRDKCPVARKGFQGAYQYEISSRGDSAGAGAVVDLPLKDGYSHVQDAGQYAMMRAWRVLTSSGPKLKRF